MILHYHESLLLDADGFVVKGAAMNVFFIKDNKVITTSFGTILDGITRRLVIQIAKDLGYKVTERLFKLMNYNKMLDEVFSVVQLLK